MEKTIKLLMVEDCPSDVHLLKQMLKNAASTYQFDIASVPRLIDAFQSIENNSYDVVLLDLNLIDMDGIACVAALHAEIPNIPIIVYTGTDDPKIREESLRCGASHYLIKGKESAYSLKYVIESTLGSKP